MELEVQGVVDLVILNGPEIFRTIPTKEGVSFLGRSLDNDIRIDDKTISRKHLKIESVRGRHFVTDLSSRNGTFYDGKYVIPGHEVEVKEGVPLAIGMTVICFGEGCKEQIAPFLDAVNLIRDERQKDWPSEDRRAKTEQKRSELLTKVALTLKQSGPLKKVLEKVLGDIFQHLKRIDRGAFVLVDPQTLQTLDSICKVNQKSGDAIPATFSAEAVQRVLESGKPLVFSKAYAEEESGLVDTLEVQKIESVICLPLINRSQIMGAIYVDSVKRPDGFRRNDVLILLDIGQRVALAVEKARLGSDLKKVTISPIGEDD
jgi:two-component system, NtrC family, sensor kinase